MGCEQQSMLKISFHQHVLLCVYVHLSPNLHPLGSLNFVHSRTCHKLHESPHWQLLFLKFIQGSLFAFPDGPLPVNLVNLSDKVNEVVPLL